MKQKRFSEEHTKLLQEARKGEKSIEELCREAGCSTASFYTWKAKYGDATVNEVRRLRQPDRENDRLLKLLGQRRLAELSPTSIPVGPEQLAVTNHAPDLPV
ncbi:transposase [Deinococcus hopiensis]|uniref:Putative transposase n=1 Tax=Deinococcus hopiensis KR-140 TaxID=695939 RepID=A0A1W1VY22_9DEIO|nr:transposase [Deinococcus hopiensis]SMB97764.1 putative transposase [Deinococcus hopiensis KR-140]